jgi:hypothetical protein
MTLCLINLLTHTLYSSSFSNSSSLWHRVFARVLVLFCLMTSLSILALDFPIVLASVDIRPRVCSTVWSVIELDSLNRVSNCHCSPSLLSKEFIIFSWSYIPFSCSCSFSFLIFYLHPLLFYHLLQLHCGNSRLLRLTRRGRRRWRSLRTRSDTNLIWVGSNSFESRTRSGRFVFGAGYISKLVDLQPRQRLIGLGRKKSNFFRHVELARSVCDSVARRRWL